MAASRNQSAIGRGLFRPRPGTLAAIGAIVAAATIALMRLGSIDVVAVSASVAGLAIASFTGFAKRISP